MTVIVGQRFEFPGEVIGVEEGVDVAVIKIEPRELLPTLTLGDSDKVAVGDEAIAIGYPISSVLGANPTVTKGIV